MRRASIILGAVLLTVAAAAVLAWGAQAQHGQQGEQGRQASRPFGGQEDVAFAHALWKAIDGHQSWRIASGYHRGRSPHGQVLRIHWNILDLEGRHCSVIVKDNFSGQGATVETVSKSPAKYLVAVTVMVRRQAGYDPEDENWYWVKYEPDGTVATNPQGVALAGRVAKGTGSGCIACHRGAGGGDFVFFNDGS